MRTVKVKLPDEVVAAYHQAAVMAGCSPSEAYGTILVRAEEGFVECSMQDLLNDNLRLYRELVRSAGVTYPEKGE